MRFLILTIVVLQGFSVYGYSLIFEQVPPAIQEQILNDLDSLTYVSGKKVSHLHQQVYGDVEGRDYADFFAKRISSIGVSSCGGGSTVACVTPASAVQKRMFLSLNYIKFSHPQIARIMVLFHEARHAEPISGFWQHARCPQPFKLQDGRPVTSLWSGAPLAGQAACDLTPVGSYGSTVIMLKNIQKFCSTCNEKIKFDAGIYGDDQMKRIISPAAYKWIVEDVYK